ncbi:putative BNR repeat neuraminidase [Novosphingobium sp. PhB55]|uniref:BNR-4 repeat-containing protein n=1 Tax=Novosphingobium sp. PhB55 TaxID=2485106 RepID=UPI0010654216|nr:BNR-4 repeat-containing protein [Novosphingobium sp. PhB55]TDW59236.1 putative BNR repeat neuraminidase [Novosphingobium sp. PhB55]
MRLLDVPRLIIGLSSCLLSHNAAATHQTTPDGLVSCEVAQRVEGKDQGTEIALVWTGAATAIGSATDDKGNIFAAYYAPDRNLTIARFDLKSRQVCRRKLDSFFQGWDGHNETTLVLPPDGSLHLAGNMHASPLVYASGRADDLRTLRLTDMTGRDEKSVTYPHFMFNGQRQLLFLYRDGASGAGRWLVNQWNGQTWKRIAGIFDGADSHGPVSAYPTNFVKGAEGNYHVAVVWRRTWDVATNFRLTYASTKDFKHWKVNGKTIVGPLRPEMMEAVDSAGENNGLVNDAKLVVLPGGEPLIFYTRYQADGRNAIFIARRTQMRWNSKSISVAHARKEIVGGGSLPDLPTVNPSVSRDGQVDVRIAFGTDIRNFRLDPWTLKEVPYRALPDSHSVQAIALRNQAEGMTNVIVPKSVVRRNGVDGPVVGTLRWFVQKANADKPWDCTQSAPRACHPHPSPLLWFSRTAEDSD